MMCTEQLTVEEFVRNIRLLCNFTVLQHTFLQSNNSSVRLEHQLNYTQCREQKCLDPGQFSVGFIYSRNTRFSPLFGMENRCTHSSHSQVSFLQKRQNQEELAKPSAGSIQNSNDLIRQILKVLLRRALHQALLSSFLSTSL